MAMRCGEQPRMLGVGGAVEPDGVLVEVTPAGEHGRHSLGVSVGGLVDAVRCASVVIAQVNERAPYTFGEGELERDDIDFLVEASTPLVEFPEGHASARVAAVSADGARAVPDCS